MKNTLLSIFLLVLACGCSSSDDDNGETVALPKDYVFVKANGHYANQYASQLETNINLYNGNTPITRKNDCITVGLNYGLGFMAHGLTIKFDSSGKLISASQRSTGQIGVWNYNNYRYFPSNYFDVNLISLDETTHRIKAKISGKVYLDKLNMNSEAMQLDIDIDCPYYAEDTFNPTYLITSSDTRSFSVPQYCNAKFNNLPWIARQEYTNGTFSSVDPYQVEVHFDLNSTPGSFAFNPSSTDNYIRFSKFNTTTMAFDYYNVTGTTGYTVREDHGFSTYMFLGTFSFTAVNPNNPADVITVTDGNFCSFQTF